MLIVPKDLKFYKKIRPGKFIYVIVKIMPSLLTRRFLFYSLILTCFIWLALFKDFIFIHVNFYKDSYTNFCYFKYFFNSLFDGHIPLWDPYLFLGRPFLSLGLAGMLNPVALLVFALHFLGLNYVQLYVIYLIVCFFFGILGSFLLGRIILKHDSYALIFVWLVTFSGFGCMLFREIYITLLFITAVWFFVFFLKFFSTFTLKDFWGMIFTLMLAETTYYPFYFICLISVFLIVAALLFPQAVLEQAKGFFHFIRRHKIPMLSGILGIVLAMAPLFLVQRLNAAGEINSSSRHSLKLCGQAPSSAAMQYNEIAYENSLANDFGSGEQFAHFSYLTLEQEVAYMPLFCYLILLISLPVLFDRKKLAMFLMALMLFLIGLAGATPVYKFLFEHIFFFKYFRNLFFFLAYVMPLMALFASAQLKSMEEQFSNPARRWTYIVYITLAHLGFYLLLRSYGCIFPVSYITVILSLLLFTAVILGAFKNRNILLLMGLGAVLMLEPAMFIKYFQANTPAMPSYPLPYHHDPFRFHYVRPEADPVDQLYGPYADSMYPIFASLQDSSGKITFPPDFIHQSIADFYCHVPLRQIPATIRYKLALYDNETGSPDIVPRPLLDDSDVLNITHFDPNSLTLAAHFPKKQFLVYRDAYSRFWKAFINGREADIHLTQYAFKGVLVPAGKSIVEFRYAPYGGEWIYILVMMGLGCAFLALTGLYTYDLIRRRP